MAFRYSNEGRLVQLTDDIICFFCGDGTIRIVDDDFLFHLFTGFKNIRELSGNDGHWYKINDDMWEIAGYTIAAVKDKQLIIYDASIFNGILSTRDPNAYITVEEYAKKYNKGTSTVKKHCENGRIPGAKKINRHWFIPKMASYPEDLRAYNGAYNKKKKPIY